MMGTLAAALARKEIRTSEDLYRAEVEGDIENVNGVLKITQIRVDYHLTTKDEGAGCPRGFCIVHRLLPRSSERDRLHRHQGQPHPSCEGMTRPEG